jgi:tRNA (Thr-GGU) A37 N-methylase
MPDLTLTPIGTVRSTRTATEDDHWDSVVSSIELDPAQFTPEALAALDAFSHVEVLYFFEGPARSHNGPDERVTTAAIDQADASGYRRRRWHPSGSTPAGGT